MFKGHNVHERCSEALLETLESRLLLDSQIGTVTMPFAGYLSAAVYDSSGNVIRTLMSYASKPAGNVALIWDGKNDAGTIVSTDATYEWRAVISQVTATSVGSVGDSGRDAAGNAYPFDNYADQGPTSGVSTDSSGNIYVVSWWEEAHKEVRKYNAAGVAQWGVPLVGAFAVAGDGTTIYVARSPSQSSGENRLYAYNTINGADAKFGTGDNLILLDPTGSMGENLRLAVDQERIWVADPNNDRIAIYSRSTGAKLDEIPITDPQGMAVQRSPYSTTPGVIWVSHSGDRVSRFEFTIDQAGNYRFVETGAARLTGLAAPGALDIGGTAGHLFVAETGSCTIREYDVAGATPVAAGLQVFGGKASPGPVTPNSFRDIRDIAVDSAGRLAVSDAGNNRTQRFYTQDNLPAGIHAGDLFQSIYSEFQPSPFVGEFPAAGQHRLVSGPWVYTVDHSGTTHSGWMGDGKWVFSENWTPADAKFYSRSAIWRTLNVGGVQQTYVFYLGAAGGLSVYQVNADRSGFRRSAILGGEWTGVDGQDDAVAGRWSWRDADGDGAIDWDPLTTSISNGEVVWDTAMGVAAGYGLRAPGVWVDEEGNFWIADWGSSTVKVPLLGFDSLGNPMYD